VTDQQSFPRFLSSDSLSGWGGSGSAESEGCCGEVHAVLHLGAARKPI